MNDRHEGSKQISNHSISELLKKDSHPASEKPSAFSVTNIYMLGNNMVNKAQSYFDIEGRRRREVFADDVMMTRSYSFDGVPAGLLHSPDNSFRNAQQHRDEYSRRAITPSMPPAGIAYPSLLMSTASHGDARQRNKYTCRSAGNTPLSSPGPFLEKPSFFADRYMCRGSEHENGTRSNSSDFGHEHKIGFDGADSYVTSGSTPASPSKSFLKKQRDDGMER